MVLGGASWVKMRHSAPTPRRGALSSENNPPPADSIGLTLRWDCSAKSFCARIFIPGGGLRAVMSVLFCQFQCLGAGCAGAGPGGRLAELRRTGTYSNSRITAGGGDPRRWRSYVIDVKGESNLGRRELPMEARDGAGEPDARRWPQDAQAHFPFLVLASVWLYWGCTNIASWEPFQCSPGKSL